MKLVSRLIKSTLLAASLLSSAYSQNAALTETEFNELSGSIYPEQSLIIQLDSIDAINSHLSNYTALEQTFIKHLWIETLSNQTQLTDAHNNWVNSLIDSQDIIKVNYSDHPNKALTVVNISANATALLRLTKLKQFAKSINKQWQTESFNWENYISGEQYRALLLWIRNQNNVKGLIGHFLTYANISQFPDNEILATLLQAKPSNTEAKALLGMLWRKPVDEFTYQIVQGLPTNNEENLAIEQLVESTKNDLLASQAFLLLAEHYPNSERAQQAIEDAVFSPQNKWLAFMALTKMDNPEFKQQVLKRLSSQKNGFNAQSIDLLKNSLHTQGDL